MTFTERFDICKKETTNIENRRKKDWKVTEEAHLKLREEKKIK